MKKLIVIAFIGITFAVANAFAHCGTCGVGGEHKAEASAEHCKAECAKPCCADKAECTDKAACEKPKCGEGCEKPCCKKAEAPKAEGTASAEAPAGACCAAKAAQPA